MTGRPTSSDTRRQRSSAKISPRSSPPKTARRASPSASWRRRRGKVGWQPIIGWPAGADRFWASGVTTALRKETGELRGFVKVMQDATARKQAQEKLQEEDRRKNEFLAMLAHELRNPLAPIRNALQIIRLSDASETCASRRGKCWSGKSRTWSA